MNFTSYQDSATILCELNDFARNFFLFSELKLRTDLRDIVPEKLLLRNKAANERCKNISSMQALKNREFMRAPETSEIKTVCRLMANRWTSAIRSLHELRGTQAFLGPLGRAFDLYRIYQT